MTDVPCVTEEEPVASSRRLELSWSNKDMRLLSHGAEKYEWVQPTDWRVSEVRLLEEVADFGDEPEGNLVIHGDALHALTSLSSTPELAGAYVGKVKLCYIDPPFNTGETFKDYDDAVEHSVWLTMLRDRLVQIRRLLADDGSVWVHLDDAEQHRARCVLDEVFGVQNFVATVIWKKSHSRNNSAQHFSSDHDFIHVYARNKDAWRRNRVSRTAKSDADFWNPDNDPRGDWRRSDLTAAKPYSDGAYEVVGPHGDVFTPRAGRYWGLSRESFEELRADNRLWWGKTGRTFPFRKRFKTELGGLVPTTIWPDEEVGNNREAKGEIVALLGRKAIFATPKPERLMEQIIHIASEPGDVVLDCFAGSGTTAAVAHKMGRRYVTVELSEDNLDTYVRPRLEKVVKGEDAGGVTGSTGWPGGGGFRLLRVASSMFEADEDGDLFLADWAVGGDLARAVCAQVRYEYEPTGPFTGRKGRSRLAVLDGMLTAGVAELLLSKLAEKETLLVVAQAIEPGVDELLTARRGGSKVRKMPRDLARRGILPSRLVTLTSTPDGATS
ncbi:site-specific DNA-methyltransferase [Blastococcus sp. PRF04-17]|uniref:site-specific DNA-methyltransferase n=1 Tax=Blastococcus sp. PRF04-17 TaxID=2933797 RepID=UPI001FF40F69|nr:site-specific DNA-methyltransferase [Blastococcus sp. PRF04-17]UOY01646.1 site-specific DNA-methyltransferase [Blastococcus sp. PRF04-17]